MGPILRCHCALAARSTRHDRVPSLSRHGVRKKLTTYLENTCDASHWLRSSPIRRGRLSHEEHDGHEEQATESLIVEPSPRVTRARLSS